MESPKETEAFKLGLINNKYKIIKTPVTQEDFEALSPLNVFVFKLKRALGTRVLVLFKYLYLKNFKEDAILKKLAIKGSVAVRAEIKRIASDAERERKDLMR